MDMPVIHAGNGKFISTDRLKCVNAKLNAGEKNLSWILEP